MSAGFQAISRKDLRAPRAPRGLLNSSNRHRPVLATALITSLAVATLPNTDLNWRMAVLTFEVRCVPPLERPPSDSTTLHQIYSVHTKLLVDACRFLS